MPEVSSSMFLAWVPLVTPMPVWDFWWVLLLPLVAGVAVVYKTMKCRTPGQIPREAAVLAGWILAAMLGAAVVLGVLVETVIAN